MPQLLPPGVPSTLQMPGNQSERPQSFPQSQGLTLGLRAPEAAELDNPWKGPRDSDVHQSQVGTVWGPAEGSRRLWHHLHLS